MSVVEKRYWNEGIKEGRLLERERIIKLLEENLGEIDWEELIALIRAD